MAAQEALAADQAEVAKAALLNLHALVEKDTEGNTFKPGDEALIVSNLVKLFLDKVQKHPGGELLHHCGMLWQDLLLCWWSCCMHLKLKRS